MAKVPPPPRSTRKRTAKRAAAEPAQPLAASPVLAGQRVRGWLKNATPMQIALGISLALHALLLTFRFVDPEGFNRTFTDTPLEVILVNARSN